MIFGTVGTIPFPRLIQTLDDIASRTEEEVIVQVGNTPYVPVHARYFAFLDDFNDIVKLHKRARIIVCHAGVGSILTAIEYGKKIVVVPRDTRYHEHYDDHQFQIAERLAREGIITVVWEMGDLETVLHHANTIPHTDLSKDNRLIQFLKEYIDSQKMPDS